MPDRQTLDNAGLWRIDVGGIKPRSHAFVIRIWVDRAGEVEIWRGYITHVVTEERQHFVNLTEIIPFIRTYLERGEAGEGPRQAE